MTGRMLAYSSNGEKKSTLDLNFLAVWREENGHWRFLAWQSCKNPPPATPAAAPAAPVRIGRFEIRRAIASGGMATVYAATHRNQKRVAIKMLHPEVSVDKQVTTRFTREGYLANTVGHPGTVSVLDEGRTRFTRSASGTHRYLIVDAAEKDRVVKTYTDVSSAKPVAPAPRRPRVEIKKEEPPAQKP